MPLHQVPEEERGDRDQEDEQPLTMAPAAAEIETEAEHEEKATEERQSRRAKESEENSKASLSLEALRSSSGIFRMLSEPVLQRILRRFERRVFGEGEAFHFPEGLLLLHSGSVLREGAKGEPLPRGAVMGEARLLGIDDDDEDQGNETGEEDEIDGEGRGGDSGSSAPARFEVGAGGAIAWALRKRAFGLALLEAGADKETRTLVKLRPPQAPSFDADDPLQQQSAPSPSSSSSPQPQQQQAQTQSKSKSKSKSRRKRESWRVFLLRQVPLFDDCSDAFLKALAGAAEDVFLAAGDCLPTLHEKPALHVVAAGKVHLEGRGGVLLRILRKQETFGEFEALDLPLNSPAEADVFGRCPSSAPALLLRISREALLLALHRHPEEHLPMEERAQEAQLERNEASEDRYHWVQRYALPALAQSDLLAGCPPAFLSAVGGHSSEVAFEPGAPVVTAGKSTSKMMLVLEGELHLLTKSGAAVGRLGPGASLGDVEALGLSSVSTYSAVAACETRILQVSQEAFQRALKGDEGAELRAGFEQLVASRREQVERGLPLTALKISAKATDHAVQAVCLQAERVRLPPRERFRPSRDEEPSGPKIAVLTAGRVIVEFAEEGREVLTLDAGAVFGEGLLADCGATLRASLDSEFYRFRSSELLAASRSEGKPPSWFYEFRLLEKETTDKLRSRLETVRRLLDNRAVHPADPCIRDWTARRQQSIQRANETRAARKEVIGVGKGAVPELPLLPPDKFGTTAFRSWDKVKIAPPIYASLSKKPGLPKGLKAYPCMSLPRIQSEPSLQSGREGTSSVGSRSRRRGTRSGSSSAPRLVEESWDLR